MVKMLITFLRWYHAQMPATDGSVVKVRWQYLSYWDENSGWASLSGHASANAATNRSRHPRYAEKSCEQRENCLQWACFALLATIRQTGSATAH